MIRTRFRPSANGPLHFGGAYVARQNWLCARAKFGQFVLLVDDVVPPFTWGASDELSLSMRDYGEQFVEDLAWLGYAPHETVFASTLAEAHHEAASRLGIVGAVERGIQHLNRHVMYTSETGVMSGYHPWLVAGRVSDDHELGITDFVRGGDLLGEVQLYDHFARSLYGEGYRIIQEYTGTLIEPAGDICSKSNGTAGIADYRAAGVTPEQINEALSHLSELGGSYGMPCSRYWQVEAKYLQPAKQQKRRA